jgi:hypothetical protein
MPRVERDVVRRVARPAAIGVALVVVAWAVPGAGLYTDDQPADVALYQEFGEKLARGEIPYRSFSVEYPPAALPAFLLPALGAHEDYTLLFKLLMLFCAAVTVVGVTVTLTATEASRRHVWTATVFAALTPLALGETALARYDFWPVALVSLALASLALGGVRLPLALLAIAAAAKVYPLVALPVALVWLWRRGGGAAARSGATWFVGVGALVLAPFLVLGPGGIRFTTLQLLRRPLQIESLGGSLVAAAHRLGLAETRVTTEFGSQNPDGPLASPILLVTAVLLAATLTAAVLLGSRRTNAPPALLLGVAAAVCSFVAFGKVLSPQYLIWLIPLVPLVRGRVGVAASTLLLAALALTRAWFPGRYEKVTGLDGDVWLVVARNALLVGIVLLLLARLRRLRRTHVA